MKKLLYSLVITSMLTTPALAFETEGGLSIASDYRFRGISQTTTEMAVQSGINFVGDSGFSLILWGSNVRLPSGDLHPKNDQEKVASLEFDIGVSYNHAFYDEDYSLSIAYVQYRYPGAGALDYPEWLIDFGYKNVSVGLVLSTDYYASGETANVINLGYAFPLGDQMSLNFHYGRTSATKVKAPKSQILALGNLTSYQDYSITFNAALAELDLGLGYVSTNVSKSNCGGGDGCDGTAILTLSKSF